MKSCLGRQPFHDPSVHILEERSNYKSVRLAREALRKQFEAEVAEGMMVRTTMTAARKRYGKRFELAPQGVQPKGGRITSAST